MRLLVILVAWYFIHVSPQGVAAQLGPFETRAQCETMRTWVDKHDGPTGASVSECWPRS